MHQYMLDTHIVVWLLTNDSHLPASIREDIDYYQHRYTVSQLTLLEMVQLQQLGKVKLRQNYNEVLNTLKALNIDVFTITGNTMEVLEALPFLTINGSRHTDLFDRYLVAEAISYGFTMISADQKLPAYQPHGLQLMAV